MDKQFQLQKIAEQICSNTRSPLYGVSRCVPGEGDPNAAIFFAGEAPGFHEAKVGRPFVGPAGQLLNELIESIRLRREEVFIGNVVHFRPPENRDPLPQEVEAEKPYLLNQIQVVDPKIVVTLGRFALQVFLTEAKISRDHGRIFKLKGRIIFPLYHPAAALRSGAVLEDLKQDFEKLGKLYRLETEKVQAEEILGKDARKNPSDEQMKLL